MTIETLNEPITLLSGQTLENHHYVLSSSFAWDGRASAVFCADGASGITIRNVILDTGLRSWQSRWNTQVEPGPDGSPPGVASGTAGIRAHDVAALTIENVEIRGFPHSAIDGSGWSASHLSYIEVYNCLRGIICRDAVPSSVLEIDHVKTQDLWGPAPGLYVGVDDSIASRVHDAYTGGDGIAVNHGRSLVVHDCSTVGEMFGSYKFVNARGAQLYRLHGNNLHLQGDNALGGPDAPAKSILVKDCMIDKNLGYGHVSAESNGIQLSWNIEDLTIEGISLLCSGQNGHGIQLVEDVHAVIRGCLISGFNQYRGDPGNLAYALHRTSNSTINGDFAARSGLNRFPNQTRIELVV